MPVRTRALLRLIGDTAAADLAPASTAVSASGPVAVCLSAIGKERARLATSTSRALARCWEARAKGAHANPCPEPGDGKAGPSIAAAVVRATERLCKACGGADRACDGPDDLAPSALGFAASCPDVAVPDGASCGGPVATLGDLVTCVTCVAEDDSQCADRAAVPGVPAQCHRSLPPEEYALNGGFPTLERGIRVPNAGILDEGSPGSPTSWRTAHPAGSPSAARPTPTRSRMPPCQR